MCKIEYLTKIFATSVLSYIVFENDFFESEGLNHQWIDFN